MKTGHSKSKDKQPTQTPWNKGKLTGQKPHLKPDEVRAIKFRLQQEQIARNLAMFCLAIDSKLRASDLVRMTVQDICDSSGIKERTTIIQKKTKRPVQFEISPDTRATLETWISQSEKHLSDALFTALRPRTSAAAISTRQYERLVKQWVSSIGLDPMRYGTHSLRRTKVAELYRQTGNLRAAQLLLGHSKLENTARYLGVEENDALDMSEGIKL